jgi:hypothetical protein
MTRESLTYVLLNLGVATAGTGRTGEVFAALRAKRGGVCPSASPGNRELPAPGGAA